MKRLSKKGFTLVELLIVMAIIGILAAVIMGAFRSSQIRSRDAKRKSDLRQIGQALELFYSDNDIYPASSSGQIMGCPFDATPTACDWNASAKFEDSDTERLYFRELPDDISSSQTYYYIASTDGQSYQIFAHLQNTEDRNCITNSTPTNDDDCTLQDQITPDVKDSDACGSVEALCNFAVTSTDVSPKDDLD